MRSKEEIKSGIAKRLADLRAQKGYSKTKMAEFLGVDKHTWSRWETGENVPSVIDFFLIYDKLGDNPISTILDMLYPDNEYFSHGNIPIEAARKNIAKYFLEDASDHQVRAVSFILNGPHGSDADAQMEEFCAINHLPLHYRYFIAEHIYVYYMLARQNRELILTDHIMPDMDIFTDGLKAIQKSAFDDLKK